MLSSKHLVVLFFLSSACGTTVSANDAANDAVNSTDSAASETASVDAAPLDAPSDVSFSDASQPDTCLLSCPAPPPGCRYAGTPTCNPPSCGTLVCEDAAVSDVAATDLPSSTTDAGLSLMCPMSTVTFPTIDQSCSAASDCSVVIHQTDCCGNTAAIGIRSTQVSAFTAAEMMCLPTIPRCRCPSMPTVADDGNRGMGVAAFGVRCTNMRCTTFVR